MRAAHDNERRRPGCCANRASCGCSSRGAAAAAAQSPARSAGCARNLFSTPLNIVLTFLVAAAAGLDRAAAARLPVLRCGLERQRPRRLSRRRRPGRKSAPAGRSYASASVFHLRLLPDPAALARRRVLRDCWRSASSGCCGSTRRARDLRRDLFLRRPADLLVLAARRLRPRSGLRSVDTSLWGGVLVTIVVASVGIVVSLPLGILLALGRRSKMPTVRTAFGDLHRVRARRAADHRAVHGERDAAAVRAGACSPDKLLRALIGVALFASAYMAEVVRAGLQAIPKGQYEGAQAVGLAIGR